VNLKGGFVTCTGDYSTEALEVMMPWVVGSTETDQQVTAWPVIIENTQLMVFWGADAINNNQVGWLIPDHQAYVYHERPQRDAGSGSRKRAPRLRADCVPLRPV